MCFLSCNCAASKKELQLVIRRYKSFQQRKKRTENMIEYYATMQPEKKKANLDHCAEKYKTMGTNEKKKISFQNKMKYKSMSADDEKKLKKLTKAGEK